MSSPVVAVGATRIDPGRVHYLTSSSA